MAVTNAQVLTEIEALKAMLEQQVSFASNEQSADAVLGNEELLASINHLAVRVEDHISRRAGDATETINRLGYIENQVSTLHHRLDALSKSNATFSQRWNAMLAKFVG